MALPSSLQDSLTKLTSSLWNKDGKLDCPKVLLAGSAAYCVYAAGSIAWSIATAPKGNPALVRSDRELLHDKFAASKVPEDLDVIIIGSGMGGLSCAAILARLGRKVLVLDQHEDVAGGGTHTFVEKGYTFDSGLHYTVPWSVPVFALTCLKKPRDVVPFDLMGEPDGTVDKIYLVDPAEATKSVNSATPFKMIYKEKHIAELKRQFPDEIAGIDEFMRISNYGMHYVKAYLFARLLPQWLQDIFWLLIPKCITNSAAITAKDLLPQIIKNKRLIALLSSMWIDTGARPDKATFMLTGSVFRGISMEGGCYPRGGSEMLAKELVPVIESFGGRVLIRALVDSIIVKDGKAAGVKMANGQEIFAKRGVVSSAGYTNTMKLLPSAVRTRYNLPLEIPNVQQSAGFVMCNIGIKATAEEIDATNTNTWHIPIGKDGDCFQPLEKFFNDPLADDVEIPIFITFPSLKDIKYREQHPDQVTVQILVMGDYSWFESYVDPISPESAGSSSKAKSYAPFTTRKVKLGRKVGYEEYKALWSAKIMKTFLRYFPKAEGKIDVVNLSTPLSVESWLNTHRGGGVGLDVTPERFVDYDNRKLLDHVTAVPNLYLTGQDSSICGVTLCQLAGVTTALRMEGLFAAVRILAQSILLGD